MNEVRFIIILIWKSPKSKKAATVSEVPTKSHFYFFILDGLVRVSSKVKSLVINKISNSSGIIYMVD
jgi:hypothetical protein